ncbi:MAG: metallopeptidase family protein [Candidatus Limnocylindrales bacterium]
MPVRRRGSQARRHPEHRVPSLAGAPVGAEGLDSFELLVEYAIDGLAAPVRRLLDQVAIVIANEPSAAQRRENELGPDDTLYGLYEGTPLIAWGADQVPFPNKITLFRIPLEADHPDPEELAEEVRRTLRHELAHHLGYDEARLHELDLD